MATSTAGLNASALPRTAAKSMAAITAALRARRSRSATARAASARTAALLDMKVRASPGPNSRGGEELGGAGPLAAEHQRGGRERGEVGRAHAAALADGRQRVGGEHRLEGVEDRRADPVAVGGQLVEPDQQHRPHPLGRAQLTGAGGVRPEQLQGLGVGVGLDELLVGADTRGAAVDGPVLGDPVGEGVRRLDACAGRRLHADGVTTTCDSHDLVQREVAPVQGQGQFGLLGHQPRLALVKPSGSVGDGAIVSASGNALLHSETTRTRSSIRIPTAREGASMTSQVASGSREPLAARGAADGIAPGRGSSTRTVERALALLSEVCTREAVTLTECARHTGLPASTALRLLRTLESRGFISRDDDGGSFRAGPRMIQLGATSPRPQRAGPARPPGPRSHRYGDPRVGVPLDQGCRRDGDLHRPGRGHPRRPAQQLDRALGAAGRAGGRTGVPG